MPLGTTLVQCTASDNSGHNLTRSFEVRVVDTTASTLTVPARMTANATSPGGAIVTYTASAIDTVDSAPTVVCDPPSGTVFAAGDTTVQCSASDASGNSSTPASFVVHVNGASEQLQELSATVATLPGPDSVRNGLEANLRDAQRSLSRGRIASACGSVNDFISQVRAKSGKSIAAPTAATLIADATRIKVVIDCRN